MLKEIDVKNAIKILPYKYYHLVIIVSSQEKRVFNILKYISKKLGYDYINLNLKLSEKLIQFPIHERCYYVEDYVNELLDQYHAEILVLDNIGILFEPHLKIDPLLLLKNLSRYRSLVVHWNGKIEEGHLIYATASHPDYKKYKIDKYDYIIIDTAQQKDPQKHYIGEGILFSLLTAAMGTIH